MSDWYKDRCFWRKKNDDGSNGKGDLIFNTADEIIKKKLRGEEMDEWDHSSLSGQRMLLSLRMRWPNYMNEDAPEWDVDAWWKRIINRSINKIFKRKIYPYRFQGRMSRDPYIAWATACILLGEKEMLQKIKLPWYIKTPSFVAWWNYITTEDELFLENYRFWKKMWFTSMKDYVIRLNELKELAITNIQTS